VKAWAAGTEIAELREIWHRLMRDELGYDRYAAHGSDLGAGITSRLAAAYPDELVGIHLTTVGSPKGLDPSSLTDEERGYLDAVQTWIADQGGYMHQQSTRPLTLSYGLSDSPAGLLAWMIEKYRAWSGDGEISLANQFGNDFLLTQASYSGSPTPSPRPFARTTSTAEA
jgi:pimeloyl-ACP methyl ester carboxylesterase